MSHLLDTHALIWALQSPDRLSARARVLMESDAEVFFSSISLFEIETKAMIGKWPTELPIDWTPVLLRSGFAEMPVAWRHGVEAGRLPLIHRDPWDRLLVAQARIEGLVVVTADPVFARYGVQTIW